MATQFRRTKFRSPQLVAAITSLLVGLLLGSLLVGLLLGFEVIIPKGPLIKGPHISGKICNKSSTNILALFSGGESPDQNVWIAPDDCNDQDPDAIWGKQCDPTTGDCQLQVWKVGPYSVDLVDGPMPSAPSNPTLLIEGLCLLYCGWDSPDRWLKPDLNDLHYELRR